MQSRTTPKVVGFDQLADSRPWYTKTGRLEVYREEDEVIEATATLDQAAHQIVMGHHQSLLVTEKGKVVGILRLSDLFAEVAERIKACEING